MSLHVLVSYAYWKDKIDVLQGLPPEWNLLLDSGAFTAHTSGMKIDVREYGAWVKEHRSMFWHCMNLDVIGSAEGSRDNEEVLRGMGIDVVPVLQRGSGIEELEAMVERAEVVALGGVAGSLTRETGRAYVRNIMGHSRRLGAKIHVLGGGANVALKYRPYSCDSSSWTAAFRYGRLHLWHRGRWLEVDRKQPSTKDLRVLSAYRSHNARADGLRGKRGALARLSAAAWIRFSRDIQPRGVRYVLAMDPGDSFIVREAWEDEKW